MRARMGTATFSLAFDHQGTTGWSETALVTIVFTSGTRPATADIMKLVEPWQWMIAFRWSVPVSLATVRTAWGWS